MAPHRHLPSRPPGKRIAVVGGTGGIGRAFSRLLAARGAAVTVVGRTFRDLGVLGIRFLPADLGMMREAERIGTELPAEELDVALFTTGIFTARQRQATLEGIERDMAVSFLSRLVIVRKLAPRLGVNRPRSDMKPRMFIWGYPGTGRVGTPGDLNAERSYRAMSVHMNTVAGNEMLVLDSATRFPDAEFYGFNPGLLPTNIRSNLWKKGSLGSRFMEGLIGARNPTPDQYAERLAPMLVAPELSGQSGAMFDRKGARILPSSRLTDPAYVTAFLGESEALVARATHPMN
jgi:NAD(P)-dependent dehydrogenase (short-subunit alcohol dehydrogenase family)